MVQEKILEHETCPSLPGCSRLSLQGGFGMGLCVRNRYHLLQDTRVSLNLCSSVGEKAWWVVGSIKQGGVGFMAIRNRLKLYETLKQGLGLVGVAASWGFVGKAPH